MRLRKPCIHDRYDPHQMSWPNGEIYDTCPGGEFLPEGALVIEKKADGRHKSLTVEAVENVLLSQYDYEIREAMLSIVQPLAIAVLAALDALASQVGESE